MRNVKFRAWVPDIESMIRVDYVGWIETRADVITDIGGWDDIGYTDVDLEGGENCVLMQYTGLKDKNGREIFEGDILQSHMGLHVVAYETGCYLARQDNESGFDSVIAAQHFHQVEVVGNRYENPELLETSAAGKETRWTTPPCRCY